jgi:hypothetical protein
MVAPKLALRIDADGTVQRLELPVARSARRETVRAAVGGPLVQVRHHDRLVVHVRDDGAAAGLPRNPVAWALISGWRAGQNLREIGHPLYGPAVVTAYDEENYFEHLPLDLQLETEQVCEVALAVLTTQQLMPEDSQAATCQLLGAVRRTLTAPLN